MKEMGRATALVLLGGWAAALACTPTTEPTGFVFQYRIDAVGCDTTCATPDSAAPITSAARGDTVWLQHTMTLVAAVDSLITHVATVRPACAGHVAVIAGGSTVRSIPTPTCADSTLPDSFQLAGVAYPQRVIAFTQWVVDLGIAPGEYLLRARVLVRPRLEPVLAFTVQ